MLKCCEFFQGINMIFSKICDCGMVAAVAAAAVMLMMEPLRPSLVLSSCRPSLPPPSLPVLGCAAGDDDPNQKS